MKQIKLTTLVLAVLLGIVSSSLAQTPKVLIHYWNFDGVVATTLSPTLTQIPDMPADYSVIVPKPFVRYYTLPGTSFTAVTRYIDNTVGTDSNARYSVVPTGATGNQGLRLRNPLDSSQLRVYASTKGYSGIVVKYALESSSTASGDSTDVFDYSVDGGTTWKNGYANGMKVNGSHADTLDTTPLIYQGTSFGVVTVDLSADKSVDDNANFVFRFRFRGNTSLTKGNNRFDNLTFEGDGAVVKVPATITVTNPSGSSILVANRHVTVRFDTAHGVGESRTIEFSPDGGTTWTSVGNVTGALSYDWTIPNTPTTNGMIRVKDGAGTVGMSGTFIIVNVDKKTNTLIHYWDFNGITKAYNNPNIPNFPADFSADASAVGDLAYTLQAGAPPTYAGYVDNVPGDLGNAKLGASAGSGFRVRNPTDMVELRFKIPTTNFKDIKINYVIELSSLSSQRTRNFDYSADGGTTWKTAGLSKLSEATANLTGFEPVAINFGTETSVNNNPNLIFRIKFTDSTTIGGNNRFDNFTVEGVTTVSDVKSTESNPLNCSVYPNPASKYLILSTPKLSSKEIRIFDMSGKSVLQVSGNEQDFSLDISQLASGVYSAHVFEIATKTESIIKFVKQ
ncbi:MAG: T9SS type A sorting domain-containing protein [bacterium]